MTRNSDSTTRDQILRDANAEAALLAVKAARARIWHDKQQHWTTAQLSALTDMCNAVEYLGKAILGLEDDVTEPKPRKCSNCGARILESIIEERCPLCGWVA